MIDCYRFQCHNRLLGIKPDTRVSSTHRFSATYTYFANGNINVAQFRQPNSPHSHKRYRYTHTYDNRNQLTGADYNYLSGSTWTNSSEFDLSGLSYDKNGNITALSRRYEGLKTYSYTYATGTNRLSTVNKSGANISFGYDGNGNVKTIGTGYSITNTVYDWRNLPTSITKSGTTYGYRYDHEGMRVYKQEGDNIHTLRGAFGEVIATYKNGSLDYWNIVKPDGTVIGKREGSNRLYYHRDHLGSTRAVVNASGSVVQTYDYYPFGLEMPGRSLTSGTTSRERFTGHERDEEVGLDYMQARRYAAEFGRFLSVDPLADEFAGWTPYHYVHNNPLTWIDPTGMCGVEPHDPGSGVTTECPERSRFSASGFAGEFTVEEIGDKIFNWLLDVAEYAVKNGPEVMDAVSKSGVQLTYALGSATAASTVIPLGVDTVLLGKLTILSANVAVYSDLAGTLLSGIDAVVFDGSMEEFESRYMTTLVGISFGYGSGAIYKNQLKNSTLNTEITTGLSKLGAMSTRETAKRNHPFQP